MDKELIVYMNPDESITHGLLELNSKEYIILPDDEHIIAHGFAIEE